MSTFTLTGLRSSLRTVNTRFVLRTVYDWVGHTGFYGGLTLCFFALATLLLPARADLLAQIGLTSPGFHQLAAELAAELGDQMLLALAIFPSCYLLVNSFVQVYPTTRDLAPAELAVMRRCGAMGWVVEADDIEGYILYGPRGERETVTNLAELDVFAAEREV